jgi:hypothetical protein
MKFSTRDLMWIVALLGTAVISIVVGFRLGDSRRRTILELDNSTLRLERHANHGRIESLERELRKAGIPLPDKDD